MWMFNQDNFLTKKPMPETPKSKDKEAFEAFVAKYNLDPLNNSAIMNCLFEMNEKMNNFIEVYNETITDVDERLKKIEFIMWPD